MSSIRKVAQLASLQDSLKSSWLSRVDAFDKAPAPISMQPSAEKKLERKMDYDIQKMLSDTCETYSSRNNYIRNNLYPNPSFRRPYSQGIPPRLHDLRQTIAPENAIGEVKIVKQVHPELSRKKSCQHPSEFANCDI